MARSKLASLEALALHRLENAGMKKADALLVGVSGGVDSMTLAFILHKLQSFGVFRRLVIAHLDHGLRSAQSDGDRELVLSFATKHKIDCFVESVDIATIARREQTGVEEAGRNARYEFFRRVGEAEGIAWVLTAHHSGDVLETILMNIARGSGLKGLAGVPARRPLTKEIVILRPLLETSKEEIVRYATTNRIAWREDDSNLSDVYTRNRIRTSVIPAFERAIGDRDIHLSAKRLVTSVTEVNAFVLEEAEKLRSRVLVRSRDSFFINENIVTMRLDKVRTANWVVVREMLLLECKTLLGESFSLDASAWKRVRLMINIAKPLRLQLSKEGYLRVANNTLQLESSNTKKESKIYQELGVGSIVNTEIGSIRLQKTKRAVGVVDTNHCFVSEAMVRSHGLVVRNWQVRDRMQPFGMKGSRLISDILSEAGVSTKAQKSRFPIVVRADEPDIVLWVPGIRAAEGSRIQSISETAFLLSRKLS